MGIIEHFKAFIQKGKTLYFPGCTTKVRLPHIAQNYGVLLKAVGINIVTLPETICCGGFCLDSGYRDDFEQCRQKTMEFFTEQQVTKVITSDPFCYRILKENYLIPVDFAATILAQKMNASVTRSEQVYYHDGCFATGDEPRKLLQQKGFLLQELPKSAQCCGAGGLLPMNNPQLAKKIAERLIKHCPCDKIITASPLCYLHLKSKGKEVFEFSELL